MFGPRVATLALRVGAAAAAVRRPHALVGVMARRLVAAGPRRGGSLDATTGLARGFATEAPPATAAAAASGGPPVDAAAAPKPAAAPLAPPVDGTALRGARARG